MGAWGHTALECDEGLSVIDCIKCYISESYPNSSNITVSLKELFLHLCEEGYISTTSIDYLYDIASIALCEIYFNQKDNCIETTANVNRPILKFFDKHISITGDKETIKHLFEHVNDIRNNVADREITELWSDSVLWAEHIDSLCELLQNELMLFRPII